MFGGCFSVITDSASCFFFCQSKKINQSINQSINYSLNQLFILVLVRFISKPHGRYSFCLSWFVACLHTESFWFLILMSVWRCVRSEDESVPSLSPGSSITNDFKAHTQSALRTAPHTPARRSYLFVVCCTPDGSGSIPSSFNPRTGPVSSQFFEPKRRNCQIEKADFMAMESETSCLMLLSVSLPVRSPALLHRKLGAVGLSRHKPPCRLTAVCFSPACWVKRRPECRHGRISYTALSLNL